MEVDYRMFKSIVWSHAGHENRIGVQRFYIYRLRPEIRGFLLSGRLLCNSM
jgi:hypothetical protein